MTSRAAPFYCPYCGDEDLRPDGELKAHAQWRCGSCLRVFSLRYLGMTGTDGATGDGDATGRNSSEGAS